MSRDFGGLFIHHAIGSDAFSTMMARYAIRWRGAPLKLYEVCPRLPARGVNKSNNEFVTITRAPRLLRSPYLYRTFAYEINRIKKNGNVRAMARGFEKEGGEGGMCGRKRIDGADNLANISSRESTACRIVIISELSRTRSRKQQTSLLRAFTEL